MNPPGHLRFPRHVAHDQGAMFWRAPMRLKMECGVSKATQGVRLGNHRGTLAVTLGPQNLAAVTMLRFGKFGPELCGIFPEIGRVLDKS